jgi:copper(I)-binding protein
VIGLVRRAAALSLVVALVAAGCTSAASPASTPAAGLRIEDAWARPSMGMGRAGAAYLVIVNESDSGDALVGASSPAAATVELHETTADSSGTMAMHPVERVVLPARDTVRLEPGGFHVMLIDLAEPLEAGGTIRLTLRFEHAPAQTIDVGVREG